MKIYIKRWLKKSVTLDGHLLLGKKYFCDTAENALHAIPAGEYRVLLQKCSKRGRKMPLVKASMYTKCGICRMKHGDSANCPVSVTCPMLVPANGAYNRTDSAILLGTYVAPGIVKNALEAFESLYDRLRKHEERGNDITLIVEEHYEESITVID